MRTAISALALIVSILLLGPAAATAQELTARQIMERQRDLHETPSEKATVVMLLVDRSGNKKKREIRTWKKTMPDGKRRSLMVFADPADLAGTALLSWELDGGQAKQWLYMPATGKMQRVAASSKADYFMGTDFTYEDMEADDLEQFEMTLAGSAQVDGQDCWIIEVAPATEAKRKESGYGKRVFTVRKDIFFTIKVDYFDPRGRELKTQTAHDLENVGGDRWIARKTLMDNKRARHKTLMGIVSRDSDTPIDDEVFTELYVTEGRPLR